MTGPDITTDHILIELETIKMYLEQAIAKQIHDSSWIRPMPISQKAADGRLKDAYFILNRLMDDIQKATGCLKT